MTDPKPEAVPKPVPPARSLLYVPASNPHMIEKAAERGADGLILDLEDGVHPKRKEEARAGLAAAFRTLTDAGASVAVRTNATDTVWWREDFRAVQEAGFEAIVIPKAEDDSFLARAESAGIPRILLMIETARGVARVFDLVESSPAVRGLLFGSADYTLSLGRRPGIPLEDASPPPRSRPAATEAAATPAASSVAPSVAEAAPDAPTDPALDFARQRILLAARSAGISAWDAPHFAFRNAEGTSRAARRAARAGFDGMTAIHPAQVPLIHEAFAPTPEEIRWAERVVAALAPTATRGEAVAEVDGELIEFLHLQQAHRILRY